MLPAKSSDGVDDIVQLSEFHTGQLMIKRLEILFDFCCVHSVEGSVMAVEHLQDGMGIAISVVGWVLCEVGFQFLDVYTTPNRLHKCL